jgi:hypothetical protein
MVLNFRHASKKLTTSSKHSFHNLFRDLDGAAILNFEDAYMTMNN